MPARLRTWLNRMQCIIFSMMAVCVTVFQPDDVYYSRHLEPLLILLLTRWIHRKKIYFEAHEFHEGGADSSVSRKILRWMFRQVDGVIVITHRLQELYLTLGVHADNMLVAHDGIDAKLLALSLDKTALREKLDVPLEKKVICYTGHLFQWKGVYALAESVSYLPDDYIIYIVGGMEPDITALQHFIAARKLRNIVLTGYIPYHRVSGYRGAADVLVLPNSGQARISREYTSPMKLFEYMAAERPIVASDLPSLGEVLQHQKNAYLVAPDDPKALADGIMAVLNNPALAARMSQRAYQDVFSNIPGIFAPKRF
jgi:glycosyltransferase involved in cell wall biosynthesis